MIGIRQLHYRNAIAKLIQECKNMRELKQIHSHIIRSPILSQTHHSFLISRILFFCTVSELGSLSYAARVFGLIHSPNLFVYNAMIRAYATHVNSTNKPPNSCQSLILYKQMLRNGITPDFITFPFVIKQCVRRADCNNGRSIYAHVVKFGLHGNVYVQNSMISLFSECGFLGCARRVFDEMLGKDIVSWNSMIIGCLRSVEMDLALDLFRKMEDRNVITWNSMITGFVQGGRAREAIGFFHEMQISSENTVRPDKITVASALSACASLGALDHGRLVHSYLKRSGIECDMVIGTALVDMYGKCGSVEIAVEVFNNMPKKDVLAWTAMISVCALHGYSKEAFDLFRDMDALGLRPNSVTFVGLLSACTHSGLVEKGRWYFNLMRNVYSIEPEVQHFACMVDILSRAGLFDEAEELIRNMHTEPDVFVWGALLGGCLMHGNVELGEKVALYLIELEPSNHAFYIALCDIYAKAERFHDVKKIQARMNARGIEKAVPGISTIEIDGVVYEFSVKGTPTVAMEDIESVLRGLYKNMKVEKSVIYFSG